MIHSLIKIHHAIIIITALPSDIPSEVTINVPLSRSKLPLKFELSIPPPPECEPECGKSRQRFISLISSSMKSV